MATKEPHRHDFKKLGFEREVGTTKPTELLRVDVPAQTINRIILFRQCECGQKQAFDCGEADKMRVLYAKLTKNGG